MPEKGKERGLIFPNSGILSDLTLICKADENDKSCCRCCFGFCVSSLPMAYFYRTWCSDLIWMPYFRTGSEGQSKSLVTRLKVSVIPRATDFNCAFFFYLSPGVQCTARLLTDSSVRIYDETRVCESQILHQQGKLFICRTGCVVTLDVTDLSRSNDVARASRATQE